MGDNPHVLSDWRQSDYTFDSQCCQRKQEIFLPGNRDRDSVSKNSKEDVRFSPSKWTTGEGGISQTLSLKKSSHRSGVWTQQALFCSRIRGFTTDMFDLLRSLVVLSLTRCGKVLGEGERSHPNYLGKKTVCYFNTTTAFHLRSGVYFSLQQLVLAGAEHSTGLTVPDRGWAQQEMKQEERN